MIALKCLKRGASLDSLQFHVFFRVAKKLRMAIFYNKQLKKPMPCGDIRGRRLNFHDVAMLCWIRNAKHKKIAESTLVKICGC
jgi:hypothetical protein